MNKSSLILFYGIPMKSLFSFLLCFFVFILPSTAQYNHRGPLFEGDKFPEIVLKTIDGEVLKTEDLKGKVVFYNFYFAACPPCIAQKGGLNELYEMFHANDDVVFISVTFDNKATIEQFRKRYDVQFKIVSINRRKMSQFLYGYPTNFLVDMDGKIVLIRGSGNIDATKAKERLLAEFSPAIQNELRKLKSENR